MKMYFKIMNLEKSTMMHLFVKVNWSYLFQGSSVIRLPFVRDPLMMSVENATTIEELDICKVVGLCIKVNYTFWDLLLWVMSLMLFINGMLKRLWSNKVTKNIYLSIMKTESKKNFKNIISSYHTFLLYTFGF